MPLQIKANPELLPCYCSDAPTIWSNIAFAVIRNQIYRIAPAVQHFQKSYYFFRLYNQLSIHNVNDDGVCLTFRNKSIRCNPRQTLLLDRR